MEVPSQAWERVHIDFAGPFKGIMWMIIVDAFSKWPEVIQMTTTTAEKTVEILRSLFSRYGQPSGLSLLISNFSTLRGAGAHHREIHTNRTTNHNVAIIQSNLPPTQLALQISSINRTGALTDRDNRRTWG